ncbi:MAG: GGDEF domain-containing protein [Rubrivivax sp.]|nr:GGDEF domain-containing protein [Rubrivivax sp.]
MPTPAALLRLTTLIGGWLQPPVPDEALARRFRARQLQAVLRLSPMVMLANLLNVGLVAWGTWGSAPRAFLAFWALAIVALVARGLSSWWRSQRVEPRSGASPRALRRATWSAAALGAVWGVMPVMLLPGAPAEQQLLVATVHTGMTCAGGFALATLPTAGVAYVAVMCLLGAAALLGSGLELAPMMGALLLIYGAIVAASVVSTARLFGARFLAEAQAARQNEVIGLLLRDFEEHASDLLWEVDRKGCLRHASSRIVQLFGLSAAELSRTPVLQLAAAALPEDDEALQQFNELTAAVRLGAPFRDLALCLRQGRRTSWWSLSAKPLLDEQGRPDGWRGVATDVTAARTASRRLSWLAHNDALTGLANRYQFRHRLAGWLADCHPQAQAAVLCLDLDHFKMANDRLGHAAGDALLQAVGERLRSLVRRNDVVARLGGDEFAVLLPGADAEQAEGFAQRLLELLGQPCEVGGLQLSTQASVGIALAPRDGTEVDELLNRADLALYAAKAAGRNAWRVYASGMEVTSRRRTQLEQALRGAIERGELRVVFQPQARLSDWALLGFEALLRWRHPELGEVPPSEYIPIAEDAGLMPALGDWVLEQACRQAAAWPQPLPVSVNVSPVQALDSGFVGRVLDTCHRNGLAPGRLELEITESVFLQESATTQSLRTLRQQGVRIALDDFGTGYSALAYLRRFPFDTLKIDRSFVRELATRGDARAIVRMILGLAHTLGMHTVAEGVEEPAHAQVLERHGCEAMQGYLVARPMPADEVSGFMRHWPGRPRDRAVEVLPTDAMPLAATD